MRLFITIREVGFLYLSPLLDLFPKHLCFLSVPTWTPRPKWHALDSIFTTVTYIYRPQHQNSVLLEAGPDLLCSFWDWGLRISPSPSPCDCTSQAWATQENYQLLSIGFLLSWTKIKWAHYSRLTSINSCPAVGRGGQSWSMGAPAGPFHSGTDSICLVPCSPDTLPGASYLLCISTQGSGG